MSGERLFGAGIAPSCAYCEHTMQSFDNGGKTLCEKYGVVLSSFKCRSFIYDPLKRVPKKPLIIENIEDESFMV